MMLKILYWLSALAISFLAMSFFGYAIAHGGGVFLLIFPVLLLVFAFPYYYLSKRGFRWSAGSVILFAPVALAIGAVGYFFLLKPMSEKRMIASSLKHMHISSVTSEPLLDASGAAIGIKIRYTVTLERDLMRIGEYTQYFPDVSIAELGAYGQGMAITKGGISFNAYEDAYTKGEYVVSVDTLMSGVRKQGESYCGMPAFFPVLKTLPASGKITFLTRIILSNRMGYVDYEFPPAPLEQSAYNPALMINNAGKLPICAQ